MTELSSKRPSAFLPAAGWIPWPGRSQVRLTGADRAKFLHNFCTNDIKKLQPGQGCEAFLTNIKGRILGHIFVFAGADDLMIDTVPGEDVKIRDHLDRYLITEDVQLEVVTEQLRSVYCFGTANRWPTLLAELLNVDLGGLAMYGQRSSVGANPVVLRRFDVTASPGYEVVGSPSSIDSLISALEPLYEDRNRMLRVHPAPFDIYRIDAGFPIYGVDLSEEHLAQEAGRTDKAISFNKGCYLGQEPIARIDALGHVNRMLQLVEFDSGPTLHAPVTVFDSNGMNDLGILTSVARAPGAATIAMGMLRIGAKSDQGVRADSLEGPVLGRVVPPASA